MVVEMKLNETTMQTRQRANSAVSDKKEKVPAGKAIMCRVCEIAVSESPAGFTEQSIECECCMKWLHTTCANLEEKKYKAIVDLNLHWYCPYCDGAASKLYQHCVNLQAEQNQIKQDIELLKTKVDQTETRIVEKVQADMDQKIATKIDEKLQQAKTDILQSVENKINAYKLEFPAMPQLPADANPPPLPNATPSNVRITEAVNEALIENQEIQKRKLKLMLHNFPEADNITEESQQVKELIETKLQITDEITITEFVRFGKTTPKLLRIELETLSMKRKILSKATTLRQLPEGDKYAKVYIRPDLTPKQQEESKNLWEALKTQRLEDQGNLYKIRAGRIIKVGPNPNPPT